jgi:hypothetical protein
MFRFILIALLVYLLWRVISFFIRLIGASQRSTTDRTVQGDPAHKVQRFSDVKDADFEDLPPDKNGPQ